MAMAHTTSKITIYNLNVDCVFHLCKFLSPIDRLRLGLVIESFIDPIAHFIQSDYVLMDDLIANFSIEQTNELIRRFGVYIKRINCFPKAELDSSLGDGNMGKYFQSIPHHCPNIENIIICYPWQPNYSIYSRIFDSSRRISKVSVACSRRIEKRSSNPHELDIRLGGLFRYLPLKSLDVSYQRDLMGKCLPKLKYLTELNLEYCDHLEQRHLIKLFQVAQLKVLNIINCHRLNDTTFETMYSTQITMENIAISNNYRCHNLELVGRLENLRHIQFEDYSKELIKLRELLEALVEYHSNDLETLEIHNDYTYGNRGANILRLVGKLKNIKKLTLPDIDAADDEYLKEIIKNCSELEELHVNVYENGSWIKDNTILQIIAGKNLKSLRIGSEFRFNHKLLKQIYELLKTKRFPLNLYLDERSIDTSILNTADYKANEQKFKIHINEVNIDDMLTNSFLF